jgi:hypothetical protein
MKENHFEKFKSSRRTHQLTKLNESKRVAMLNIFGFGMNVYAVEESF